MIQPRLPRLRLPRWTTHPLFGIAVLLVAAISLIAHGEPQPSSRPSGKSVVPSGTPSAPIAVPATLVIRNGLLEYRQGSVVRRIVLPGGARPTSMLTNRGVSVVLASTDNRQRGFAVTKQLQVIQLGYADAVLPAAPGGQAFIVEASLNDPGRIEADAPSATPSPSVTPSHTSASAAAGSSSRRSVKSRLRDFAIRRYDSQARRVSGPLILPAGTRAAADTAVGLVVWKPLNLVFDGSTALEPLSASATLIRPDGSYRPIGPVFPLAATATDLLVWNVERRQFGVMPLQYVTSTATTTESPSMTVTPPTSQTEGTRSTPPTPEPTPTVVAGSRWFEPTKGFTVTGPATFAPDGSSFAVYASVGNRRRLVVAQLGAQLTNQIEVLALNARLAPAPAASPSGAAVPSGSTQASPRTSASSVSSTRPSSSSRSGSASSTTPGGAAPDFDQQGFPFPAPLLPQWWGPTVVALGTDGTVISYQPGSAGASLLDLGLADIASLAQAP